MSKNQAFIAAAIGASGSGKSAWVKAQLRKGKPRRLLVFDPQDEYGEFGQVFTDLPALADAVLQAGRGPFAAVLQPGGDVSCYVQKFDWLCRLAYAWGNCTIVCDELGDVTKAGWAPPGWSMVIRKGRHAGLRVFGLVQRPALTDKTFFSLATMLHCGRLNSRADVQVMADVLQVPPADLIALRPLEWIERNMTNGDVRRGVLTF